MTLWSFSMCGGSCCGFWETPEQVRGGLLLERLQLISGGLCLGTMPIRPALWCWGPLRLLCGSGGPWG